MASIKNRHVFHAYSGLTDTIADALPLGVVVGRGEIQQKAD